ncbi:hypothetical protein B4082_3900 [Bacillus cereus]|uniref:Uncharacterized protein n=1 Tax=Bacillus cereus TaxID=1396 RepID=A0A161QMY9_BACCE|nr:hypothetical protein B4082_3900 [Bacillus cereus]
MKLSFLIRKDSFIFLKTIEKMVYIFYLNPLLLLCKNTF